MSFRSEAKATLLKPLLKVLLVSPLPPPASGIASWSVRVLRELGARCDVSIFHVDTAVRWRSTNDSSLLKRLCGGTLQALCDTARTFVVLLKQKPDVIHVCTSGSLGLPKDILILGISKLMRLQSVLHYRKGNLSEIIKRNGVEWKIMRLAIELTDCFLLLDQKSDELLRATLPHVPVERIPNPIDTEFIQNLFQVERDGLLAKEIPCIMFAGWVIPAKGVRELVEACCGIAGVSFELNIVGNVLETFQRELEAIAVQRDEGAWLKFQGMVNHTKALEAMECANIFVLPSHTEGFPNVVLEAMALGKPIIATKVGAIPEMLDETTNSPCGMLVAPCSVDELRSAITYFLTHPADAELYGERAKRKVISHYAMDKVLSQYLDLWRSLAFEK